MSVIAKLRCNYRKTYQHKKSDGTEVEAANVTFKAIRKDPPGHGPGNLVTENEIFGEYTPSCEVSMCITNPAAHRQFEVGKDYYVTFEECAPVEGADYPYVPRGV